MALYLLFDSTPGYALFHAHGIDEIGQGVDAVRALVLDLNRFGRAVKLAAFFPFPSALEAFNQCKAVSEGIMTNELRSFLELNLPKVKEGKKAKFGLGVMPPKVGSHISEVTGIPCQSNEFVQELLCGVRLHFNRFISDPKNGACYCIYHFVGVPSHYPQFLPPPPPPPPAPPPRSSRHMPSTSVSDSGTPCSVNEEKPQLIVVEDNDDSCGAERSAKRLLWTKEDDLRLINAWLNNSVNPIDGNSKKCEMYWANVAASYNNNSPRNRRRKTKHCKDHWNRTNKKVVHFNNIWCWSKAVHASGRSDDQLMDNTRELYKSEAGQYFNLDYWWKAVRDHPKWMSIYTSTHTNTGKRTKLSEAGNHTFSFNNDADEVAIEETHPEGCKAAKERTGKNNDTDKVAVQETHPQACRAAMERRKGKDNAQASSTTVASEDIECFLEAHTLCMASTKEMTDIQLQLSKEKLESAQALERAAQLKMEAKMYDKHTELLLADTRIFDDLQKSEHERALKLLARGSLVETTISIETISCGILCSCNISS